MTRRTTTTTTTVVTEDDTPVLQKGAAEVVVILDESGSMEYLTDDTIGGFNSFIRTQKEIPDPAKLTVVKFSYGSHMLVNGVDLHNAAPMLSKGNYRPSGGTALFDAVMDALTAAKARNPWRCIFVIVTDGAENSSRRYRGDEGKSAVKNAIEERTRAGWQFVFLGANMDVFSAAQDLGIAMANSINVASNSAGTRAMYDSVGQSVARGRQGLSSSFTASDYAMQNAAGAANPTPPPTDTTNQSTTP